MAFKNISIISDKVKDKPSYYQKQQFLGEFLLCYGNARKIKFGPLLRHI